MTQEQKEKKLSIDPTALARANENIHETQEDSTRAIIQLIMDGITYLHATSILTNKEADVYSKLVSFSEYHTPLGSLGFYKKNGQLEPNKPALLQFVINALKYRMSIGGQRVQDSIHPYKDHVNRGSQKSLKERILNL
jgi:hypothetical protein